MVGLVVWGEVVGVWWSEEVVEEEFWYEVFEEICWVLFWEVYVGEDFGLCCCGVFVYWDWVWVIDGDWIDYE